MHTDIVYWTETEYKHIDFKEALDTLSVCYPYTMQRFSLQEEMDL